MYSYTVPLTLFLLPHAIHTLLHIPISLRSTTTPLPLSPRLPRPLTHSTYPTFFIFSSAILMHAWMYTPSLLPRSYASWISSAAHLHPSILSVLRSARMGRWLYASDLPLPDSSVLSPLASRLALPPTWADPANLDRSPTDPRGFGTTNGGAHGVRRFIAGWSFAMRMYFPLQLVMGSRRLYQSRALLLKRRALRQKVRVVLGMVVRAAMGAARSSVFLGAFIAGFYYTVCLARTRVGPRVFSKHGDIVSPQMWDAGMAITAGCLACGWSIWLERKERRGELALWVWPRAGVCLTGRVYEKKDQWRERLAFVSSAAIVLAAAQEPENLLKGVFGKLLRGIYA
ncbi:hypothetical protein P152DRAFT_404477 [Eremomyces bilateralis CBS 781.70]|uniref:Integral membrane protein n=1 Tax=Eremomyces bilateralis CBS 781.70 TaxID=1392243 RepID=A0A6G1FT06_9PEZI|nr:uncharacterized protein P152DRAFT_404477 [Eremomyces bilateralis CBS 781.70]KAF1808893.1 hypothetical protein P152DRAFT_404477 [Eremomyces bilateralis CBS 781.70]